MKTLTFVVEIEIDVLPSDEIEDIVPNMEEELHRAASLVMGWYDCKADISIEAEGV